MSIGISVDPLPIAMIEETVNQATHSLSIREAWLYRDFQSAIGDLMINEVTGGSRRFEVVGFAEFEEFLLSERPDMRRWMERLNRTIDGLGVSGADRFDARVGMLEDTLLATIDLLRSLCEIDPKRGIVSDLLLEKAGDLKSDTSWRNSAAPI